MYVVPTFKSLEREKLYIHGQNTRISFQAFPPIEFPVPRQRSSLSAENSEMSVAYRGSNSEFVALVIRRIEEGPRHRET